MNKMSKLLLSLTFVAGLIPAVSMADVLPGKHPGYLHSLTDMRTARWLLSHQPGDAKVYAGEDVAITELNAAIAEMKKASIDDGKDINDHPAVDVTEHGSRLLKSIEVLKKAHADIDKEEDNPEVRELRHHALEHLDRAIKAAEQAHSEWLKEKH